MQEILSPIKTIMGVCGRQPIASGPHRLSHHCLRVSVAEGELLYHTMTGELLLLSSEEAAEMLSPGDTREELIVRWYLVPEAFDENLLAQQVREAANLLVRHKPGVTRYVVFTTTDCNARCPYCYELGRPRRHMPEKVAHDAAAFIARRCEGNDVRINWFGGEPLVNYPVIDIVTQDLAAAGVGFISQMTSNGYLLDGALVRHARDAWNLRSAQVTLDGTEHVYNQTKAYVGVRGSAFERVMSNIALLADAGVKVNLRLNMSAQNEQDLWQLSEELVRRFGGNEQVRAYVALLRGFESNACPRTGFEQLVGAYSNLQRHLDELGIGLRNQPKRSHAENQCMADNDRWLTILPDGRLGKCEHDTEERLVGSIYEDSLDDAAIREWKQAVQVPACSTCLFIPTCVRLAACEWNAGDCTEDDRALMRLNLTHRVLNALHY